MNNIKQRYSEYGIREWIALAFGCVILGIQVFRYATNTLSDNGVEIFAFAAAILLILAPKTLLSLINKKGGGA